MTARPFLRGLLVVGLLLAPACTQIIGIEDASVDDTIGARTQDTAGTSSVSGSLANMPTAGAPDDGHSNHGGTGNPPTPGAGAGSENDVGGQDSEMPGTGGAPTEPGLCERYCDEVTTNCKGKYEQYRSFDQCIEVCKRLPPGEAGDDNVNSVSCRVEQAGFAAAEPFLYCKSAGPLGAGRCGSNCISYCSIMQATCTAESTGTNLELSYFESSQACVENCNAIPTADANPKEYSSSASADITSFVGNNVYCRTYHVAAALEQDAPDEHCPHAMGGDPCIDQ